ncbi:MAG: VCBS repeat-containing protein [Anaerolineales bacterium]|nr:VCBS repeat-containing protein [Anaerolineales bacterium]MCB8989450.1 VCBS repeat-containing protein [Ardenticatenaceae bacterium]MCB9005012.1 VCBS repeat-containing protein [Ardenticatenaceae bacterium]
MQQQSIRNRVRNLLLLFIVAGLGVWFLVRVFVYAVENPYSTKKTIRTYFDRANSVLSVDMDQDGDLDILGSARYANMLAWWENNDGTGSSWIEHIVESNIIDVRYVQVGDIDNDGDTDILAVGGVSDTVAWWENTADGGTSWVRHNIDTGFGGARTVQAADIDTDGDLDIVGAARSDNEITWWENTTGSGTTWATHIIDNAFTDAFAAYASDINGDGDVDIVGIGVDPNGKLAWWENVNGNGLSWTIHVIDNNTGGPRLNVVDLDRDGDNDVLSSQGSTNSIFWWENTDGNGSVWTKHTIDSNFADAWEVYGNDLDTDGDIDILGSAAVDDEIAWWEKEEEGNSWITHTVANNFDGARGVYAADVDSDGDTDILGTASFADEIAWWKNEMIHQNALWGTETIVTNRFDDPSAINAVDIDGDGDLDMLGASQQANEITWWENTNGSGSAWVEHIVTINFSNATSVANADVDRDGDTDILSTAYGAGLVSWWENANGIGSTWFSHTITSSFTNANTVTAADIDHDGDIDALGTSSELHEVVWWENTDSAGIFWTQHTIANNFRNPGRPYATDIDQDGDLDVVGTASQDDIVVWWENTSGTGITWTEHLIDASFGGASSVFATDLDADGDTDVLATAADANIIAWWENTNANGSTWTQHVLATEFNGANQVYATDLDHDGDIDVLGTAQIDNEVSWWESDGNSYPNFTKHLIRQDFTSPTSVFATDINGDSKPDIMATAAGAEDVVVWWQNCGGQTGLTTTDTSPATLTTGDVDDLLRIVVTHNGRSGDHDLELSTISLLLSATDGTPLTDDIANALIENLFVYRDDGSGNFEPDNDILITNVPTLTLSEGHQTVFFVDGDIQVQVPYGTPVTYFIVVELTTIANLLQPGTFVLTHLVDTTTEPSSTVEDRDYDIPLSVACTPNISATITVPPKEYTSYLPVISTSPPFPLLIGYEILPRPVSVQGEVFYTTTIQLPGTLPANGHFYFSATPNAVNPVVVDDELILSWQSIVMYHYLFAPDAGQPPVATILEIPRSVLLLLADKTVTITYRDVHGYAVNATPIWLIWEPN